MAGLRRFTAIIEREESGYSALCPEYDIASQGATIEEARDNFIEALSLFSSAPILPKWSGASDQKC